MAEHAEKCETLEAQLKKAEEELMKSKAALDAVLKKAEEEGVKKIHGASSLRAAKERQ